MKAYVYSDQEVRKALGNIRADAYPLPSTLDKTTDPNQADLFFVPFKVEHLEIRHPKRIKGVLPTLQKLPHWEKHEDRHFMFMHGDEWRPIGTNAILFRWSVNKDEKDPRTVTMPAPAEDWSQWIPGLQYETLLYHISFMGFIESPDNLRRRLLKALGDCKQLHTYIDVTDVHYGAYEGTELGKYRRQMYKDIMRQSRLTLAPRGAGMHSYRFVETMASDRIPVLVADQAELPFEDLVDYDYCIFRVAEKDASVVHERILEVNEEYRPDAMAELAAEGYRCWKEYLAPDRWDDVVAGYLEIMLS